MPVIVESLERRSLLSAAAVVVTDAGDYAPGSTAIITGTDFDPGENVTLQVTRLNADPEGPGHEPWIVVADATGAFTTTWFVNPDYASDMTLNLTAVGDLSSSTSVTFTDATLVPVNLSGSTVPEGAPGTYTFTATIPFPDASPLTVNTTFGPITIAPGSTTGTLTVGPVNSEDVYIDPSSQVNTITSVSTTSSVPFAPGPTKTATAFVTDTINQTTVNLTASSVPEGSGANYTFTATLTNPSQGTTTVVTNQGTITIANGQTIGTLVIASGNTEDVYVDPSSLTATITSATGGNFEQLVIGTATATAFVTDTINPTAVDLIASTVFEGSTANYTFTATLTNPSQGITTIVTDLGTITIGNGQTIGALVIASGNTEDVYLDASSLTATITSATGGNFEQLTIGAATATAYVNDTIDPTTVNLSASTVYEGATANYIFTATLNNPSQGTTTIVTDQGSITIGDGQTIGTLVIASGNTEDVYLDASSLTATITSATGGNFEQLGIGAATATAYVNDTIDPTTVNLSASTDYEGATANYTFTATLNNPSQGTTTIVTDQGTITIGDGQTTGTLVIASGNTEDVYLDASSLTATITSATGGNFEQLGIGAAAATAYVNDTIDLTTVDLSASTVYEGATANYTFTATLSNPSQGTTTIVTDQGTITIGDGETVGTLVIASGNTEDVYLDASSLTATITSATGGNFEQLAIGAATATAYVNDTIDPTTVNLSASTVYEGATANYTFTATLNNPSQGTTTIVTDLGTITIGDGQTIGTLVIASGNTEDVYLDSSSLTATITSATGGNFEQLGIGAAAATAYVNDTIDLTTVDLSASTVYEGATANYIFTATLNNPSQGTTTIVTDQGTITIGDGQTIGTLVIASGNTEDVYLDASSLTATITSATGGNFEQLGIGAATATAYVNDTINPTTVNLSASTVYEGPTANYTFTAILNNPSQGTTTIVTNRGTITIANGQTVGTLVVASGNTEDVYLDASNLTATITSATGGNFEKIVVGTASATAYVNDTINTTTVTLNNVTVNSNQNVVYTASVNNAVTVTPLVITLNNGATITIPVGSTTGSSSPQPVPPNTTSYIVSISSTSGGNYEKLNTTDTACVTVVPVGSISGTKYRDVTGNGFSAEDTPLQGARISLYFDANNNGVLDSGDGQAVKTAVSATNGTYAFIGLAAGTYFVQENAMTGYVRTGPSLLSYYTVNVTAGSSNTGYDFDNAEICDKSDISCITYTISGPGITGTKTVSDLRGNTFQGDTVTVKFYVKSPGDAYSLVSYIAPTPTFDANLASQQIIYQSVTVKPTTVGWYTATVVIPNSDYQVDFVCCLPIDRFGPAGSNIFYSAQGRLFSADNGGTQASSYSSLAGTVYVDKNSNGNFDTGDTGLPGVTVTLTGTDAIGRPVNITATTGANGSYSFTGLIYGTYTLTETHPAGYGDQVADVGTQGGTATVGKISSINLAAGVNGNKNNFGEIAAGTICDNDTATIGFWQNQNGQTLIKALNGSSTSTALATWLSKTYPNLFGATAGIYSMLRSNGTPMTNAEVASSYVTNFFNGVTPKANAQVLSLALATYVTSSNLAGSTVARTYGFNVTTSGIGSKTFNIGANGAAFGVSNNSLMTLSQMLAYTNSKSKNGLLYNGTSSLITSANSSYSEVNQIGDI